MPKQNSGEEAIVERIAYLCNQLFGGSQSRMAEKTAIRQGTLSNVLTGKRAVGKAVIDRLVSSLPVDPGWLLTGTGDPLLRLDPGELALPVAAQPFQGLAADHPANLKRYMLPVHRSLYRTSRYWVEIAPGHALVGAANLGICPDDIVLFEPDPEGWPADVTQHPCLVRNKNRSGVDLHFGVITAGKSGGKMEFELAGGPPVDSSKASPARRNLRGFNFPDAPPPKPKPKTESRGKIVAVGIYREGRFGSF